MTGSAPPKPTVLKFPRKPSLILPVGTSAPGAPGDPNVVAGPRPAPINAGSGEEWASSLDCLRELVNDIESGRLSPPTQIYICMQTRSPTDGGMVGYPSYSWAEHKAGSHLTHLGLLSRHQFQLNNR